MHGEKLHYAKQAASHLIDLLNIKDRLAVVMYDTEINVVSPSRKMSDANKDIVKGEIQRIISRGSTNLFAGWVKGCEQVAERMSGNSFNRALLLSDGLATPGTSLIARFQPHASELVWIITNTYLKQCRMQAVVISTF